MRANPSVHRGLEQHGDEAEGDEHAPLVVAEPAVPAAVAQRGAPPPLLVTQLGGASLARALGLGTHAIHL